MYRLNSPKTNVHYIDYCKKLLENRGFEVRYEPILNEVYIFDENKVNIAKVKDFRLFLGRSEKVKLEFEIFGKPFSPEFGKISSDVISNEYQNLFQEVKDKVEDLYLHIDPLKMNYKHSLKSFHSKRL